MRIVLSNASGSWGGVHRVTEILSQGLTARGHEVTVMCRPGSPLHERMRDHLETLPVLRGMDLHPATLVRVAGALRRRRPDVLVTLTKKDVRLSAPVARALGVPVVVRHGSDQGLKGGPYGRMLYGAVPTRHVTNAEATRRTILRSAPWLDPARVSVIYNGVDADACASAPPADLGLPAGALVVGCVGRMEPSKGLAELADAWPRVEAALPGAHLVIVGRGTFDAELRARLAGRRVLFTGHRADLPSVMAALDLLVLPSYSEGVPNVVMEAMAAGKPVLATAVSGVPELVVDGETGLLIPPRDADAIADGLIRLGTDAALRARLGAAGMARVREHFTLETMVDGYDRLLRDVAASRPGRSALPRS
ncbi:glycosyltransferase family 4 protein [Longimicrobium sp.]|uniref:glycosyltransferase family 4 protein n=1 Tax=Longimicrobium sp. TaxID=2029185 RepID=UPI002E333DD0|nr:glycosyltransferase family 4 protein [Longimicrobium sp.]HEX6039064.1 glycosyltransferase family 4 protein [Longimicrobium sp.]